MAVRVGTFFLGDRGTLLCCVVALGCHLHYRRRRRRRYLRELQQPIMIGQPVVVPVLSVQGR